MIIEKFVFNNEFTIKEFKAKQELHQKSLCAATGFNSSHGFHYGPHNCCNDPVWSGTNLTSGNESSTLYNSQFLVRNVPESCASTVGMLFAV